MDCDTCEYTMTIERDHRDYNFCFMAAKKYGLPYHFVLITNNTPMWCPKQEYNKDIDKWVQCVKEYI